MVGIFRRRLIWAVAIFVIVFHSALYSCGAQHAGLGDQGGTGLPPNIQQPVLPAPGAIAHGASAVTLSLLGSEFDPACSQRIAVETDTARFSPDWVNGSSPSSGLAYGLYRFNLAGYSEAAELRLDWGTSQPPEGQVYIGLGDWAHARWEWMALPSGGVLSLPDPPGFTPYINSETGEMLVVVLCLGQQEAMLQSCSVPLPPVLDPWLMYGHDAQHTGRSKHTGPATNALKWQFAHDTGADSELGSPAVGPEGQIYAGGQYGLYAFNADGSSAWYADLGDCTITPPVVAADGTVYIASGDKHIYAYSAAGVQAWAYDTVALVNTSLAVAANGLLYYTQGKNIYALNPDGTLAWSYANPALYSFGSPACGPGSVVYATHYQGVIAVDPLGNVLWSYSDAEGVNPGAPAVDTDGKVYCQAAGAKLLALDAAGVFRWRSDDTVMFQTMPVISADHRLFVLGTQDFGDHSLYALDANGVVQWQTAADDTSLTRPLILADGSLVFGEGAKLAEAPELHHLHAVSASGIPLWTADVKGSVLPQLAQDSAGHIYCTTELYVENLGQRYRIYAFDTTGVKLWSSGTGTVPSGSAVIGADGRVYAGYDNGDVIAFNADGSLNWTYETDGRLALSSPALRDDGTVYVSSMDNHLFAINDGGTLQWQFSGMHSPLESSPMLGPNGTIYFGDYGDTTTPIGNNGVLYALDPSGAMLWSQVLSRTIYASPAISLENLIFLPSCISDFHAYTASGVEQWLTQFSSTAVQHSSVAIGADGTLYVGGPNNALTAMTQDGAVLWTFSTGGFVMATPAIAADGTIMVGCMDNKLYAVNPDGTEAWQYATGGSIFAAPVVDGAGTVYFASWDNNLYALNADGTLAWTFATGGELWCAPSIGIDGTVYVGSNDGYLYAIGPGTP